MANQSQRGTSSEPGLRRVLGPIDATCIVVGAIIGVGIFFTPSQVAEIAQSPGMAMTVWAIGGGIALLGALTFAELGNLYPRSGAQYDILRDAYSPLPAFLFVFCNATAIQAGAIAVIAVICTRHLGVALGFEIANPFALVLIASTLIIGLTAANAVGVRWGSRIQNLTVYAKLLTLLVVTFLAVLSEPMSSSAGALEAIEAPSSAKHPLLLICAALLPAFFAYGGWQHALWMAAEIRQPKRNVPLAIVGGVVIVVTVYLLANWAYLHLLGYQGVVKSKTLAADAVARVWPRSGARLAGAAVAVSAFGVLNAQLLSGPRLIHEMAQDGRLFRSFAYVNRRFNTPLTSIALLGVLALVLLFATRHDPVMMLVSNVVFLDAIFFALTGIALILLRRKQRDTPKQSRFPGRVVVPFLFVIGELSILAGALVHRNQQIAALIGVGWIIVGAVLYWLLRSGRSGSTDQSIASR